MASGSEPSSSPDSLALAQTGLRAEQVREIARLAGLAEAVSALAHQLSQPLGAIANYAAIGLHQEPEGTEEASLGQYLHQIAEQASRAGRIVQQIRRMAQGSPAERSPTDINGLIREAASRLAHQLRSRQVELRLLLEERLPEVPVDPLLIERVVAAMLENAIEATETLPAERRHATIETSATPDGHVEVAVADSAAALAPNLVEQVFEPFYTTKPGRLGLGLTSARLIARSHGGRLQAECCENGTTVFHLTLPVATGEMPSELDIHGRHGGE
jgi:two-component system sensor histidine kinase TtrS